ncbi:hypothetical protein BGZ46_003606 [Entomortierella lignicola]|nr:hypothetical protein BGZ46_003606 [Entomortierella lignicola]
MPMFLPNEASIYQQIFDTDSSNEPAVQQQQYQSCHSYPSPQQQKQQQPFLYPVPHIGLGTPPTSPPSPAFFKYSGVNEIGTMFYGSQPQAIQNAYVIPTQPISVLQHSPLQLHEAVAQHQLVQEQLAYHMLMGQFDNPESSVSSSSPTISSLSSSLSSSPFAESPLMAINSDFDLFPKHTPGMHQATNGFPIAPVMAPPSSAQAVYNQSDIYSQIHDVMQDTGSDVQQPMTTELSLLCKCPGKFPCGEQLADGSIDSSQCSGSISLHDIRESELSESDSGSEEEEQQEEEDVQDTDPSYTPRRSSNKERPRSMTISNSPYSSPYSKGSTSSPSTPVRQDRRRSSSGSYSSGHSHSQQLLEPDMVPEIKDIHVCPVCQRRFTRPFNLRSHLMTHTTARPFPCDECHWKFTRQHDLLRHKRAKHPNSVSNNTSAGQKKDNAKSQSIAA